MRALFLLTGLAACDNRLSPADTDPPVSCGVSVDATVPAQGSTDAYGRAAVEFHLSAPDETATIVADFAGTPWVSADGLVVGLTPDDPLAPETVHTVTLDYCSGTPALTFTTSELGAPLGDDVTLAGRAYRVDLAEARFAQGDGLADVAATLLSRKVLAAVDHATADEVFLRFAIPDAGTDVQNPCSRTVELPGADFTDSPFFSLEADEIAFSADEATFTLERFALTGTVAPDGERVGGITFSATLDGRDVATYLGLDDADSLCAIAASIGIPCEACPSDASPTCVTLDVDQLEAVYDAALVVDPVLEPDPSCG